MSTRRRGDEPAEVETAVFQCAAPLRPAPSGQVSTYESQLGAVVEPSVVGVGFVVVVGVVSLVLSLLLALLLVGSKGRSPRAHGVHARRLAYMCILAMVPFVFGEDFGIAQYR